MNWRRLKSNAIAFLLMVVICNEFAFAKPIIVETNSAKNDFILRLIKHLPEQAPSWYNSYSGIVLQKNRISTTTPLETKVDSSNVLDINQETNHLLFSSEVLTQQKMLKPTFYQSEILSTKTEGKPNDLFNQLNDHLNNLSILNSSISIFNISYLSPFSEAAADIYVYLLNDSITTTNDTLCLISFSPKAVHPYNGFSGTATVNPKTLTFRKIIARTTTISPKSPFILIQQDFEMTGTAWLPSEIKTKVLIDLKEINDQDITNIRHDGKLIIEGTKSFYQQEVNLPLTARDFKPAQQLADRAQTTKDLGQQQRMIRLMEEGKFSIGSFDLNSNRFFGYNLYERMKIGLAGETNYKLSKYFSVGGSMSYGLKDQAVHYEGWTNIFPSGDLKLRIHLGYQDMNMEYGKPDFPETQSLLNPESTRTLLIKNMYATKRFTTGIAFRMDDDLNFYLFADESENKADKDSPFIMLHPFETIGLTRSGLQVNYSSGEKKQSEHGLVMESNPPESDFYLTMIQGLTLFNNDYRYTKFEFRGKFDLSFSTIGLTTVMLRGGYMTEGAPLIEYFNGYGSYAGAFTISAPYTFETMRLNEFAASGFVAIFIRHDFSHWMFRKKFKTLPAIIFDQNIGIGQLGDQNKEQFHFQDYRKGFYESGLEVNNLLRLGYFSCGAAIYYRYGPYQLSPIHENFAYRFGISIKL